MISLYDGQITDLLGPNCQQDTEVQCLIYVIREGMRVLLDHKDRALIYAGVDSMQEEALDLLAAELRAQYYDTSYSIDVKRAIAKQAIRWHQVAGTKAAVEELAKSIFGSCTVNEWYEYGGDPFYFRIITDAPAGSDDVARFNILLEKAKNLRSHIESVSILRSIRTQGNHSIGFCVTTATPPAIYCIS